MTKTVTVNKGLGIQTDTLILFRAMQFCLGNWKIRIVGTTETENGIKSRLPLNLI